MFSKKVLKICSRYPECKGCELRQICSTISPVHPQAQADMETEARRILKKEKREQSKLLNEKRLNRKRVAYAINY